MRASEGPEGFALPPLACPPPPLRGGPPSPPAAGLDGEKRGEYVLVVAGAAERENPLNALPPAEHIRHYMAQGLDKKEALKRAARDRGVSKSALYPYTIEEE